MNAEHILGRVSEVTDWDERSQLLLLCSFVEELFDDGAEGEEKLYTFLRQQAREEADSDGMNPYYVCLENIVAQPFAVKACPQNVTGFPEPAWWLGVVETPDGDWGMNAAGMLQPMEKDESDRRGSRYLQFLLFKSARKAEEYVWEHIRGNDVRR